MWNLCGGTELSATDLVACGNQFSKMFGMIDLDYNQAANRFTAQYWDLIDRDGSGRLSKNEYRHTMAGLTAVQARIIMKGTV